MPPIPFNPLVPLSVGPCEALLAMLDAEVRRVQLDSLLGVSMEKHHHKNKNPSGYD